MGARVPWRRRDPAFGGAERGAGVRFSEGEIGDVFGVATEAVAQMGCEEFVVRHPAQVSSEM